MVHPLETTIHTCNIKIQKESISKRSENQHDKGGNNAEIHKKLKLLVFHITVFVIAIYKKSVKIPKGGNKNP